MGVTLDLKFTLVMLIVALAQAGPVTYVGCVAGCTPGCMAAMALGYAGVVVGTGGTAIIGAPATIGGSGAACATLCAQACVAGGLLPAP